MRILAVCGFLGSGKTSCIRQLAAGLMVQRPGLRLAVLENEVNPRGIDGQVLAASGLQVRELVAGCICCSLAGELPQAIAAVQRDYDPELLLIEASGVAAPPSVRALLQGVDQPLRVLLVLDAARLRSLPARAHQFVTGSLAAADLVVISNRRRAGVTAVAAALACVNELPRPPATVVVELSDDGDDQALMTAWNMLWVDGVVADPGALAGAVMAPGPVATASRTWAFDQASQVAEVGQCLAGSLARLARAIAEFRPDASGHIKALLQGDDGSWLQVSVTALADGVTSQGARPESRCATLTVSAILFGLPAMVLDDHLTAWEPLVPVVGRM